MAELFIDQTTTATKYSLQQDVTKIEIQKSMFSLGSEKNPGLDGFFAYFLKKTWNIVGCDVAKAIHSFFQSGKLLGEVNSTIITLVPKTANPSRVGCNFVL